MIWLNQYIIRKSVQKSWNELRYKGIPLLATVDRSNSVIESRSDDQCLFGPPSAKKKPRLLKDVVLIGLSKAALE